MTTKDPNLPNIDQIIRDLEKQYGKKIVLSKRLIERVLKHANERPGAQFDGRCGNSDQVCTMCDAGSDNCTNCDWGDWTCHLTTPDT